MAFYQKHVYFSSREVFLYKAWANSSSYDEKLNFKDLKFLWTKMTDPYLNLM